MYALVDCNNFYASCERVFNPNLQHRPVVILSNNDGCVIARSDEAKALQIPMGAPIFKWHSFCKAHHINVLSSNYPLYGDMSTRVMNILKQFTPDVEIYSIDEAFLQFKGFNNIDFKTYGTQIRHRILKWTGIPTAVGIAPTKALSKVANRIARKFPHKTKGVYVIDSDISRLKALQWMPLQDVWGIGSRLLKRLQAKGCKTAYDFTHLDDNWVRKTLSITVWRLKKDLEGIPKMTLDIPVRKKAIATTRSFDYTYNDINYIKERVATFAVSCAEKLRKQNSFCHVVVVSLKSNRYQDNHKQHRTSTMVIFSSPTNSSLIISKAATSALEAIYKKGINYKKAGVVVTGLVPSNNYQLDFFTNENPKHKTLMKAMDQLNEKYKAQKIKLASQDLQHTWKMRQDHLSPRYTTNINDIIVVK